MTNQPQCGEAHGCGHPPDLAVASFAEFKTNPAGWNRAAFANRRLAIADCLCLVLRQQPCFGRTGQAPLNHHASLKLIQLAIGSATLHLNPILPPMAEARIGEALLQPTVIGEQQQAFAVGIEAPSSVNIGNGDPLSETSPATLRFRCELTQNPVGLVEQQGQLCAPKQSRRASPQLEALLRWSS